MHRNINQRIIYSIASYVHIFTYSNSVAIYIIIAMYTSFISIDTACLYDNMFQAFNYNYIAVHQSYTLIAL